MFRKVLLAAFVLFVVLPCGILVVEHVRGQRQLDARIRELEARGESLDAARLLGPPPPISSNGLANFVGAMPALSDAGSRLPPTMTMIGPGRAISPTNLHWWPAGRGSNDWAAIAEWVRAHESSYDSLHEALSYPLRRAVLDFSDGFAGMKITHLAPFKQAATALSLSAADAAHRGELEAAVFDLAGMRTLVSDLADEPILISQLVRVACSSIACGRAWAVVHERAWSDAELLQIQNALPPPDYIDAFVRSLEVERAVAIYDLRRLPTSKIADLFSDEAFARVLGGGTASDLSMPSNVEEATELAGTLMQRLGEGFRTKVLFPVWRFAWGDQALVYYLDATDVVLRENRAAAKAKSLVVLESLDLPGLVEPKSFRSRLLSVYAANSLPVVAKSSVRAFRAETERALHETGIAIRRYQLRHGGAAPETLKELVPDFLSAVPVDRMDGQPLRYRHDSRDSFTLWSVGDDLKDNGGDGSAVLERPGITHWARAQDAVWPLPASAEEAAEWHKTEADRISKRQRRNGGGTNTFRMSPELMQRYGLLPGPTNSAK